MKAWYLLAALAAASCSDKRAVDTAVPEPPAAEPDKPRSFAALPTPPAVRDGAYRCEIWEGSPFVCLIETTDGVQTLHKIHGTHRVKGEITATESGFRFVGVYASNYHYKWKEIDVVLARTGPDSYRGVIDTITYDGSDRTDTETLTLTFESDAYGGKSYGGFFDKAALEREAADLEADMAHGD